MQITQKTNEKLKRAYEITVPHTTIATEVEKKLQEIGKTAKMPGFRPGKIPAHILKQNYGQRVMGEVIELTIDQSVREAITKESLKPALQPKVEITSFEDGKDLSFSMELEVLPEVPAIAYDKVSINRVVPVVADEDVDETLNQLASNYKDFSPISGNRAAKNGDQVEMDFKGMLDGEAFDGGAATGHRLELGSGQFIPGFEEQLVGVKKGDEKAIPLTFPTEYHAEHLAGKDVVFEVKVHDILEAQESKIDDAFAQRFGTESVEQLKERMAESLKADASQRCRVHAKKELFDALDAQVKCELPETMLEREVASLKQQNEQAPEGDKIDEAEIGDIAERRVKLGIVLAELAAQEKITVSQEELNQALFAEAQKYPGQEQKVFEHFREHPEQLEGLRGPILEDKVVDFLLEKVKVTDKDIPLKEVAEYLEAQEESAAPKKKPAAKKKAAAKSDSSKKATATKKKAPAKKPAAKKSTTKAK